MGCSIGALKTAAHVVSLAALVLGATVMPVTAQSETVEYYGLDALGSVRVIFNAQGGVIDRMDYGPFGENLRAAIKFPVEQFAQLARDAESGQDYAQARNYASTTGRFNRVDPVYSALFDPQQWNRFTYARNNPGLFVDPDGEQFKSGTVGCRDSRFAHLEVCNPDTQTPSIIDGWSAELRGVGDFGRSGRGGRGGGAPTPTTPSPPPSQPTPTPSPTLRPESDDDCRRTARTLGELSQVALGREDALGWAMMLTARKDPWRGRLTTGFPDRLTIGQGSDVYRHVWGHAGAVLAARSGGLLGSGKEILLDVVDLARGTEGANAELAGDLAGLGAGVGMWVGNITRNQSYATTMITRAVCR